MKIALLVYILGYVIAYYFQKYDCRHKDRTWADLFTDLKLSLGSWLCVIALIVVSIHDYVNDKINSDSKPPKWI